MLYQLSAIPFFTGLLVLFWGRPYTGNFADLTEPYTREGASYLIKDRKSRNVAKIFFLIAFIMIAMQWDHNNYQFLLE